MQYSKINRIQYQFKLEKVLYAGENYMDKVSNSVKEIKKHLQDGHADIFLDRYAYTPSII